MIASIPLTAKGQKFATWGVGFMMCRFPLEIGLGVKKWAVNAKTITSLLFAYVYCLQYTIAYEYA